MPTAENSSVELQVVFEDAKVYDQRQHLNRSECERAERRELIEDAKMPGTQVLLWCETHAKLINHFYTSIEEDSR